MLGESNSVFACVFSSSSSPGNSPCKDRLEGLLLVQQSTLFSDMVGSIPDLKFCTSFLDKHWSFVFGLVGGTVLIQNVWGHAFAQSSEAEIDEAFSKLSDAEQKLMFSVKLRLVEKQSTRVKWIARDSDAVSAFLDKRKSVQQ